MTKPMIIAMELTAASNFRRSAEAIRNSRLAIDRRSYSRLVAEARNRVAEARAVRLAAACATAS